MPDPDTLVTPADRYNPLLTAADIMTAAPRTCSPFSTVLEATLIFRDADCGFVPILDEAGKPIGVVTDRDVALALINHGGALASKAVAEIMSRDVATVPRDAGLGVIEEAFAGRRVRRLLVVDDDGRLLGVISWADVAPHVSNRGLGGIVDRIVEQPPGT